MPPARPAEADARDGMDQQPFGYNLNYINGIGLPQFNGLRPPNPQPPSRQILNNSENSQLDDFLNSFDNQSLPMQDVNHGFSLDHFHGPGAFMGMPPNFVGSESVLIGGNGHEVHDWQMDSFTFQNSIPHIDVHTNPALQHPGFGSVSQPGPSATQLAPIYSSSYQQQPFQPQGQPLQTPGRGPVPNFGSDMHFQPSGFNHIPDHAHNSPLQDELWLSSNPNTRPSTQPSSPVISRKRKPELDHTNRRNGFIPSPRRARSPVQAGISQSRLPYIKTEPVQGPTPHPSLDSQAPADSNADAGAESDAEYPSRTATPPVRRPSAKPAESASAKTKKKTATAKNSKSVNKASARSKAAQTGSPTQQARRQPLTLDQKKANHTNSEQRRRDATARAQARLFDLIPSVRSAPQKQSTVQKLSKVVDYVPEVEDLQAAMASFLDPTSITVKGTQRLIDTSTTDDIDAAAAGALAGMGSVDSGLMFGDAGVLDGGGYS